MKLRKARRKEQDSENNDEDDDDDDYDDDDDHDEDGNLDRMRKNEKRKHLHLRNTWSPFGIWLGARQGSSSPSSRRTPRSVRGDEIGPLIF